MKRTIVILGGGIAGNLAAAYFRQHLSDFDVAVVAPKKDKRPIVGESLARV